MPLLIPKWKAGFLVGTGNLACEAGPFGAKENYYNVHLPQVHSLGYQKVFHNRIPLIRFHLLAAHRRLIAEKSCKWAQREVPAKQWINWRITTFNVLNNITP